MTDSFSDPSRMLSVKYEVFGIVQGVFFRKFTYEEATKLGLRGSVKNTRFGTVTGVIQGPKDKVEKMKYWLSKVGSPYSVINRCEFSEEQEITCFEYKHFMVDPSEW